MGGPWESPPRPTGFLHEPTLLPGSRSPATGQNPSPKGREPPLTSDARHTPGTGGKLLCQPTRSHTRALQLVRWKVNILEILFACPGVTLGEDTVLGAETLHTAFRAEVSAQPFHTRESHLKARMGARLLHEVPCEQVKQDSAQRERKKVTLYFIIQILLLLPGN